MSTEENKAVVCGFIEEAWNKGDLDTIAQYIAPDCVLRRGHTSSPDFTKRLVTTWRTAFPDFTYHIQRLVAEDDMVIALTTFTGTHQGVFEPLFGRMGPWEPTGKSVEVEEVILFRLAEGKVIEWGGVWNRMEFLQQLDVSLASA